MRCNGYSLIGCARSMFANRLSFAFDFKRPSHSVDTACSSALYGMGQAFLDLKAGRFDAAIAIIGLTSKGFGGVTAHIIMKSIPKQKSTNPTPQPPIPRLWTYKGNPLIYC